MMDQDTTATLAFVTPIETRRPATGRPYREALVCLGESDVRHCILRDRLEDLDSLRDLDVLIHPEDRTVAFAALARAGFVLRRDRRLRLKDVFVRWSGGRWWTLDVHRAFVQGGIEYMSVRGALSRLDRTHPVPRLGREDQFLHLLMHNLLGKKALQQKHIAPLRALHGAGLNAERLDDQARLFGLRDVVAEAMARFEAIVTNVATWRRFAQRTRSRLLLRPANLLGALQYAHADWLRWGRRSVVLSLLGPDGSGKTSFADALEGLLRDSPLRAGRVYMGCWGHDMLPIRQLRRLVPPQLGHGRMFLVRCGLHVGLGDEEQKILAENPPWLRLAWNAARYTIKNNLFHAAIGIEMAYRYGRFILGSRRPVVITDRYIYDMEFRQGKVPWTHGRRQRQLWYRFFPPPDGILYLTTSYGLVEKRKPQLDRAQFETMDAVFRAVLAPHQPLAIQSDAPPEAMARNFLTQHWEQMVERCNARA